MGGSFFLIRGDEECDCGIFELKFLEMVCVEILLCGTMISRNEKLIFYLYRETIKNAVSQMRLFQEASYTLDIVKSTNL